jgi:hypothetical protein
MTLRASSSALLVGMLGVAAAALVGCSGSSGKLIPIANAGPLQSDFETIAQAAEAGDGSCSATEAAILKTEQDLGALPSSVDAGLRATLHQGVANLRTRALALCAQPLAQPTVTNSSPKSAIPRITTTTTPTTTTTTTPTTTATTPSTPTSTTTTPGAGGGTPAPGSSESSPGAGAGGGTGPGEGAGVGGAGATGAPEATK